MAIGSCSTTYSTPANSTSTARASSARPAAAARSSSPTTAWSRSTPGRRTKDYTSGAAARRTRPGGREILTRMMVSLGVKRWPAPWPPPASGHGQGPHRRARVGRRRSTTGWTAPGAASAWRWTVARLHRRDRDQPGRVYFVRFVDTKRGRQDEPNFFTKLLRREGPDRQALNRYRIQVKADGTGTLPRAQLQRRADNRPRAQKIVSLLVDEAENSELKPPVAAPVLDRNNKAPRAARLS